MEDYWRSNSIHKLAKLFGLTIQDRKTFPQYQPSFHPKHIQTVEDVLRKSNITDDNFSAIHWRAEKRGMDYAECAKAVLYAKHALQQKSLAHNGQEKSNHQFVLMSSLNKDTDLMWDGSKIISGANKAAQQALNFLVQDNGFLKIDDLLEKVNNVHDPGMLAVYDLILAKKAKSFATCARDKGFGCNNATGSICELCNHVGKFGKLALELRRNSPKDSSWACWPQSDKVVYDIIEV